MENSSAIMGLQQIPMGNDDVVIGRLYGDLPKQHGSLEVHRSGQTPRTLPTLRGVRAMETADINGDGHLDLLVADGWHYRYGAEAQARLLLFMGPEFEDRRTLVHLDSAYTINRIEVVGDPKTYPPPILVNASDGYHLLRMDSISWTSETISPHQPNHSVTIATHGGTRSIVVDGTSQGAPNQPL